MLAKKCKQIKNRPYYFSKKGSRASPPFAKTATHHLNITPPPINNNLETLVAAATTHMIAATAIFSDDHWVINTNGTVHTQRAQRVAKHRQVIPAVDCILRAGNTVLQGAILRAVSDHSLLASVQKWHTSNCQRRQQQQNISCSNWQG